MLGKGTRVQESKMLCSPHFHHVADQLSVQSWHHGLLLQFLLLDARWSVCPSRHHQPGRGSCGAPADPLVCVHSIRGGATRWLWSRMRRAFSCAFPRPRPSLSSLPWEQLSCLGPSPLKNVCLLQVHLYPLPVSGDPVSSSGHCEHQAITRR
ncbi:ATP synthase F(0) complex subunit C2, mitochondrial isoform X2 [Apodemus sylvaticus]|uniref:ATP synthase F(0) complex subunit C2, mitochondrial isoform X2 n=1 Tax=Apodemus sylvaticus TaxID=10129 RepID=UPI0022435FF3|nr:ATP synthase F(0) complex subunit C2, mitochondrial isoform X2 [Apodemus sylvaticus]